MNDSRTQGLRAIADQAAEWYLQLEEEGEVPLAERENFVRWLKASPAHVEEFMRVRATHARVAALDVAEMPDLQQALREAGSNVIDLGTISDNSGGAAPVRKARRRPVVWGAAASVAILSVLVAWFASQPPISSSSIAVAENVFATELGEQRSVLLSDGSLVELNTQSTLRVLYSDDERRVELVAGEAVFDVAKDPQRPFRVDAGTAVVKAIGTRFNVYRQASQTVVTVVEGRVELTRADAVAIPPVTAEIAMLELTPGDQVAVSSAGAIAAPSVVDTNKATAWTDRRLVFDSDSLATVAQELNRYNREQLVIADSVVAEQKISGVFDANDPATLFAFLESVGGLRVEPDPSGHGWLLHAGEVGPTKQR